MDLTIIQLALNLLTDHLNFLQINILMDHVYRTSCCGAAASISEKMVNP